MIVLRVSLGSAVSCGPQARAQVVPREQTIDSYKTDKISETNSFAQNGWVTVAVVASGEADTKQA
eukprot:2941464-Amphidinium_carterae.1